ncbi:MULTISPECIES: nuclear transport factor 2 family protein [unclassified Chelatococcus]|uniref:nuclear transport factor 2 family protein n=1 Tax=unclassified Chelatococcus TaxID=2638111 RepID=UPI001BD0A7D6|nr:MULTISPECIES: nuclear transport factor 2 family protein [unclassified Chelatococcus]MBS7743488.1 nuclear transport factor 2 family protein [Chelatococcus sp. HY11]MBX3547072.1 nuclear transport factor 2 family protein [Chelatococcus sp.]CAH1662493.1 Nuclear transport factor 2 family protein [Hyphomicrobiales bacterium]CAH1687659.1 Nuclear transport factor 2 family protein [Hyphomicrobiales bacterium]
MNDDRIVDLYFEYVNNENWDGLGDLLAENCDHRAVGAKPRLGRAAALEYFRGMFDPWREHHDQPGRRMRGEGCLAIEINFTGTTNANQRVTFEALDVFDIREGRIARLVTWYDIAHVRRLLSDSGEVKA